MVTLLFASLLLVGARFVTLQLGLNVVTIAFPIQQEMVSL